MVCCYDDKFAKHYQQYRGENAVYNFMEKMLDKVWYCKNMNKTHFNEPLKMTDEDEVNFKKADRGHICNKKFSKSDFRFRDHCHITGKYHGSAHDSCNLHFKLTDKISVIFHNLGDYDGHFIMQQIGEIAKKYNFKKKR